MGKENIYGDWGSDVISICIIYWSDIHVWAPGNYYILFATKNKFVTSNHSKVRQHSSLEGVKIENKLTGAGINAKKCKNTSPVTTKNFKIGQRGNPELWPILSFFTYFMGGWVGAPT